MEKRIASAAIFVCAVMALVAAAPLVAGDIHEVTKGAKGPNASAVSWDYVAPDYGMWNANITNNNLRWMVIHVADNSTGVPVEISREHIRFAAVDAYPTGVALSSPVEMAKDRPYVITAVPNGPKGSSAVVVDEFRTTAPPVADFTATIVWMDVTVDATASYDPDMGTIVSYDWDFGDGMVGTGVIATHTYATEGLKTITLTVTDNDGLTDTATATVNAEMPPIPVSASFTADIPYMTVTVDASASTGEGTLTYDWNWGDGMTGSGMIATHTYATPGVYTITLTVTDSLMATATASMDVTATMPPEDQPPVASFTYNIVYLDLAVDGSGSSDPDGDAIESWAWDFGDGGTAMGVTATHSYLAAGVYTVTLTVTSLTLSDTDSQQVTATEPPKPPVAAFTADIVYLDVSVDGSGSSDPDGTIVAWDWNFGDGAIASGVTATHSYATAGVKTITLTVTDSQGLQDSATMDVTAIEPPKPPVAAFTWTADYLSVSFDGSGSSDPDSVIVMWAWDFGDGGTATGEMASHVYAAGGTYTVILTVTDSQDLSDSQSESVTVAPNPPPVASFTWSVLGQTVTVDGSGSTDDQPIASYAWDFGDGGTATGATASHTYVKPVLSTHVVLAAGVLQVPQPPYSLVGFTYGPDGVTPMTNSVVTITNERTGGVLNAISDPEFGIILDPVTFSYPDLANDLPGGVATGDLIIVSATNGAFSGTASATANLAAGSLYLNVIMTGAGPVLVDYTITLTVTDSEGLTDSMSVTVTIEFPA